MHACGFADLSGRAVDRAISEDVGDIDRVLAVVADDADAAGQRKLADDDLFRRAGLGIDFLNTVVGHVGDEDVVAAVDGEIVKCGLELGRNFFRAALRIDFHELTEGGVHHPEIAFGIEVHGGRHLEAFGDDGEIALVHIDLHDLSLEPERAIQQTIGTELESVQSAHLLHDLARRFRAFDVDFVKRIAKENLGGVEPSVLAEGERIDSRQAGSELLDRAVAFARIQIAGEEAGPCHGAVRRKRDVVGHAAVGGGDRNLRGAGCAIHFVKRRARDAAGEQPSALVDAKPMHAMEGRARHQPGHLIGLR